MTYPPQPGQPYGQDPQGQQPQPGGWDQTQQYGQPQQYGQQQGWDQTQQYQQQPQQGWDPNQQYQQQGWDPNNQGYPQGQGGPPPQKSKTGLIIGIVIGVVVLIAFGVTGFVAPGFLLGKDDGNNTAAPPASSSEPAPTSAPKSSPKSSTTRAPRSSEAGGGAGDPQGVQVITDFLAKISSGDKTGAVALACENRRANMGSMIDLFLPPGSTAEVKKTQGTSSIVMAEITGTVEGADAKGTVIAQSQSGSAYCVSSLLVSKVR